MQRYRASSSPERLFDFETNETLSLRSCQLQGRLRQLGSPTNGALAAEMTTLNFGYYPRPCDINRAGFLIATLPALAESVAAVEAEDHINNGWIYAPGRARVFGLPKTHRIELTRGTDPSRAEFLVHCFGLLVGMRMSTTEAGFLDATPIGPGKLVDIVAGISAIGTALERADAFWQAHQAEPRRIRALTGTIHALMLAQEPTLLGFEQLLLLYTAMDSCYYVYQGRPHSKKAKSHGERLALLCQELGTTTPQWVNALVIERNKTVHEGLFFDEPLGFRSFGSTTHLPLDTALQVTALLSRFVVSLLDIPASRYIKSSVDTRQMHRLDC